MPRSVKLLIFDLDGTLADSRLDVANAIRYALVQLGHAPLPHEEIYSFVGNGIQRSIERMLGTQAPDIVEQAIKLYRQHYGQHLLDHTVLYPHVKETLDAFHYKKKAIISNKRQEPSVAILEGLGISHHFNMILGGDQVEEKKPAPEAVFRTVDQLAVAPGDAIIIGDSPEDIQAGRAAGLITCGVTYGFHPQERLLAEKPDYLIDSLKQLRELIE
jgi:phosphoglycolate phosphatase